MRCIHEAALHTDNCFITLTYNDTSLPPNGSLYKPDLQKFLKRLRKQRGQFRYYACGEYGDTTDRAHYHACLFGIDFHDKRHFRKIGEHNLYTSQQLNDLWGLGNTSIGNLTFETAAYTARYVMKKTVGRGCKRYVRLDEQTGELIPLVQPYAAMSLRPAIGRSWIEKYHGDIYGHDKDALMIRGKKMRPTKYYDKIYDRIDPDHMEYIRHQRIEKLTHPDDNTLRAREENARARVITRKQI